MQSRVETSIEGGTVEIVYTTDPKYIDGLSQEELVATVVGLIPALLHATTYNTPNAVTVADTLREFADMWDPAPKTIDDGYVYYESEH